MATEPGAHWKRTWISGVATQAKRNASKASLSASVTPSMRVAGAAASQAFFLPFAQGGSHEGYLSGAELKLLSEWLDVGAQYYNNPFAVPP